MASSCSGGIDHQDYTPIARSYSIHEYLPAKKNGYHIASSTRVSLRFLIEISFRWVIHLSSIWLLMAASGQQGYELYVISISIIANPIPDDGAIIIIMAVTSKYPPCAKSCRNMPYCCVVGLPEVLQWAIYPDNGPEIPKKKGGMGGRTNVKGTTFFSSAVMNSPRRGSNAN